MVSILGRRTTSHIDRDLGDEDRGIGKRNACREHCGSYTVSIILEAVIWVNLLGLLLLTLATIYRPYRLGPIGPGVDMSA